MKKYTILFILVIPFSCSNSNINGDNDADTLDDDISEKDDDDDDDNGDATDIDDGDAIDDEDMENRPLRREMSFVCPEKIFFNGYPGETLCSNTSPIGTDSKLDECRRNLECIAQDYGYCVNAEDPLSANAGIYWCQCVYDECQTDKDCSERTACACSEPACYYKSLSYGACTKYNRCVNAECRNDEECPAGEFCQVALSGRWDNIFSETPFVLGFFCSTPYDSCKSHEECPEEVYGYRHCSYGSRVDPTLQKREKKGYEHHIFVTDTDEPHWHCVYFSGFPGD